MDGLFLDSLHVPTVWAAGDSLVFVSGPTPLYQLTWFDREGGEAGRVGEPAEIVTFDVSPDGSRVVTSGGSRRALWLMDVSSRATRQLVPLLANDPRCSADAQSILFGGGALDQRGLHRLSLSGGKQDLVRTATRPAPGSLLTPGIILHDWSRDGRRALYFEGLEDNLWSVPRSGNDEPQLVVKSKGKVDEARFSPNARFVAYNEYEAGGRPEVIVVPFPPTGARFQVSTAGGVQPLWRGNGRELFYLDPNGNLMSVEVTTTPTFSHGTPRLLFRTGIASPSPYIDDYGVTASGQRFLLKLPAATNRPPELKLVLDWPALLGKAKHP